MFPVFCNSSCQTIVKNDDLLSDASYHHGMMVSFPKAGFGTFHAARGAGPSCWTCFDLFHVRDGAMRMKVAGELIELPAGCGILMYPHTPFEGSAITTRSTVGVQHFTINQKARNVSLPLPLQRLRKVRCGCVTYRLAANDDVERDIERLIEWHFAPASNEIHQLREALLVLILGQIEARREDPAARVGKRRTLDRFTEWLGEQLDREVGLDEMAQQARMSTSHFRAEFRDQFAKSPGQYFREIRLGEAARRLRQTSDPIKVIATRLGFSDLPNFYRMFRSIYGVTPSKYRQGHAPSG